ncbi:MAG: AtzE family amidohydrolase [Acidocella sp. 20-57-95]|nr:MAG: AtzE family amidohydrolase [Acidocella sp. 20-57-95]OYV58414.1 MAG: AtzE family amidohydrolase [Acidocella sp. 21-58-7]HQT62901.1 AtzE family amidohydrolase [Acidocella sp.]
MSLTSKTAIEIAGMVRGHEVSARDVLEAHIARIERFDGRLNCFTDKTFARARTEAAAVDIKLAAGIDPGPLAGVPVAVKNLFDVAGLATRAGSKIYRYAPPASHDAACLQKLIAAGAVLLGALNMDEFAFGFVTENAHDGPTRNPHDVARIAGGSSGGSAASVAAGFAPITLGSDTNGSIRVPAALCGIFGLKPTYGRIDRTGTFPFVDSFDHVGPFARSTADLALAYKILQTNDDLAIVPEIDPARVAVLGDWFADGVIAEMAEAVAIVARGLGATKTAIMPEASRARAAAFCISAFEGGQLHKQNLRTRPQDYDPATRPRLLAGALQPAETILQAQRFRAWFQAQAKMLFKEFDILLAPATPCVAPLIGQKTMMVGGLEIPVRPNLGLYTQPISFIGLPVISVPVVADGLPRGVQIIGAAGREDLVFAAAAKLEAAGLVASETVDLI